MSKQSATYNANQKRIDKQKQLLIDQLHKTPVIEVACQKVNVGRTTFYRWRKDDPDFDLACAQALEQGVGLINDLAESKLIGQIQESNFAAIRFWLQTHNETYGNKLQIFAGKPSELSDEEQKLIRKSFKYAGLIEEGTENDERADLQPPDEEPTGADLLDTEVAP